MYKNNQDIVCKYIYNFKRDFFSNQAERDVPVIFTGMAKFIRLM